MAIEYDHRADHYIALRVASTATLDDIKQAHRTLIRDLHPDHGGRSTSAATVNVARDVLMNPVTRKEYDQVRHEWHQRNPLLSIFTEAGQQLHRERTRTPLPRPAQAAAHRATANSTGRSQPPPAPTTPPRVEPDVPVPPTPTAPPSSSAVRSRVPEWRANIAKTAVAADFLQATLTGRWLKAITIMGAAHILDRVIENRIGDDPEQREPSMRSRTTSVYSTRCTTSKTWRIDERHRDIAKARTRTSPPRMDRHQLAHDSELESPQHRPARGNTGTVELGASSRLAVSSRSGHGRSGRYPGRLAAMSSGRGDAIEILRGNRVRLRRAELEEYEQVALPWYQDPEVLQLSEGGEAPYDRVQIRRMFEVLSGKGELYLIEVLEAAGWRAVGDAALIPEDVPIVIGSPQDRSRGIGTEVLQLLLLRARALGWTEIRATGIVPANYRSRQLLERAGFVEIPAAQGSDDAPIAMIKRLAP